MDTQEILYTMALTRISNFNFAQALHLYRTVGSATQLYEYRHEIGDIIHDCSPRKSPWRCTTGFCRVMRRRATSSLTPTLAARPA